MIEVTNFTIKIKKKHTNSKSRYWVPYAFIKQIA